MMTSAPSARASRAVSRPISALPPMTATFLSEQLGLALDRCGIGGAHRSSSVGRECWRRWPSAPMPAMCGACRCSNSGLAERDERRPGTWLSGLCRTVLLIRRVRMRR